MLEGVGFEGVEIRLTVTFGEVGVGFGRYGIGFGDYLKFSI